MAIVRDRLNNRWGFRIEAQADIYAGVAQVVRLPLVELSLCYQGI